MTDRFRKQFRRLTPEEQRAVDEVKQAGSDFEIMLNNYVHDGREKALALTKIEESVMWAVKGITG